MAVMQRHHLFPPCVVQQTGHIESLPGGDDKRIREVKVGIAPGNLWKQLLPVSRVGPGHHLRRHTVDGLQQIDKSLHLVIQTLCSGRMTMVGA